MDRSLIKKNFWHLFQPAISGKIVYIVVYLVFIVYPAISQATVCGDMFLQARAHRWNHDESGRRR